MFVAALTRPLYENLASVKKVLKKNLIKILAAIF